MALGKILNLGGIDNRPPKANQSTGRFRVARNVYPTPDGTLIPRYESAVIPSYPSNVRCVHHTAGYDGTPIHMVSQDISGGGIGGETYRFFSGIAAIPMSDTSVIAPFTTANRDTNNSVMSYRRNDTLYFLAPYGGLLFKYDGVQIYPAGSPQPILSCTQANTSGTKYVRVVQHTMDFDNNEPMSEYIEFPILNATTAVNLRTDGGATNIIGVSATKPQNIILEKLQGMYYKGTAAYNAGTLDYTVTLGDTNITEAAQVGGYVFCKIDGFGAIPTAGFPANTKGFAIQVKSVSPLKLDATTVKYMDSNREWQDYGGTNTGLATYLTYGCQKMFSVWGSSSQNGIYYFSGVTPAFPESTTSYVSANITIATTAAGNPYLSILVDFNLMTLGPILNDFYDVNSRKVSPNADYFWGGNEQFQCMSAYQDLGIFSTDELIWMSDPTLGGSFEQMNTSYFIKVGDKEFGAVTSICGTNDFIYAGRTKKNYYVAGSITTGNYRVQEVVEAELGAWNNVCSILIKDSVIFMTPTGVFQIVGGAKATLLSSLCPKNFSRYDNRNVNEDVSFVLSGYESERELGVSTIDGINVAYDEFRELLVFMKKGTEAGTCFVIHTRTGECYEWDGLIPASATLVANSLAFINSHFYVGQLDTNALTAKVYLEDITIPLTYPTSYPVKLYTNWLTAGEPSLEKQLLQLKLFGRIQSNGTTTGLSICNYKNWDISTKITNKEYFPLSPALSLNNQIQYSHKQRLNSDKVLSASVGLEIHTTGVLFELESIEVEFNPIQEGMKK